MPRPANSPQVSGRPRGSLLARTESIERVTRVIASGSAALAIAAGGVFVTVFMVLFACEEVEGMVKRHRKRKKERARRSLTEGKDAAPDPWTAPRRILTHDETWTERGP